MYGRVVKRMEVGGGDGSKVSMRGCYAMTVSFSLINIYFIFISTVMLYSSNSY
jgi:hypothetical protein